jgi:hypothetical protein
MNGHLLPEAPEARAPAVILDRALARWKPLPQAPASRNAPLCPPDAPSRARPHGWLHEALREAVLPATIAELVVLGLFVAAFAALWLGD